MASNSEAVIIEKALKAATLAEAQEVADLIEAAVGARYERPVGDRFNNFGMMSYGGSFEYKALELVTNSQDAVLERLAVEKWGDRSKVPYGSPAEASADLLGELDYKKQGDLVQVQFRETDPPAKTSKRLTVVYRDAGCGMEPSAIPETIFHVGSSHKLETAWQQGAFGLGGTTAYRNAKAVVLVTRRAPEMNPAEDRIAVTVVLWDSHGKGQSATYLVTTDFEDDKSAQPWSAPASAYPAFDAGTHLALIAYGVEGFHRARSGDEKSFDTALNTRLFEPVTPVLFTNEITRSKNEYLRGLKRRLADNPNDARVEESEDLLYTIDGVNHHLPVSYFVFPPKDEPGNRRRMVAKDHTVVFTSNGQVHHKWTDEEFRRRTGGKLDKLKGRMFAVVKTDSMPIELRTALFSADRSQMVGNEEAIQLEDQLADFLVSSDRLQALNSELVREAIEKASSGESGLNIALKIASAFKAKGFKIAGATGGGGAGGAGGTGGARQRKKVEVYPDPTALEGPDTLIVEDGKKRTFEYMLNAEDSFLSSGRGVLEFETDHPEIDVQTGIVVRNLRDGYVKVQLVVPEGAAEGKFKLTATLAGWQKSSGGLGPVLTYETTLEVVDEIQSSGGNKTKTTGDKAADGAQVAVLWSNADAEEGWNNATPGSIENVPADVLASERSEYKELKKLGDQLIPTVMFNETYAPFKGYVSARAKTSSDKAVELAKERYAVGTGLGMMVLQEADAQAEKKGEEPLKPEQVLAAKQAIARSVLLMLPEFDSLSKEAGIEQ